MSKLKRKTRKTYISDSTFSSSCDCTKQTTTANAGLAGKIIYFADRVPNMLRYINRLLINSNVCTKQSLVAPKESLAATKESLVATKESFVATKESLVATKESLAATKESWVAPKES